MLIRAVFAANHLVVGGHRWKRAEEHVIKRPPSWAGWVGYGRARGAFSSACTAAAVPGRILHDFRRTAVRNLERDGVSCSATMAMVGHKTESIYRRYAIVDAGALCDTALKIDQAKVDRAARTKAGTANANTAPKAEAQSA